MRGTNADQVLGQSPPPNASGIAAPKISLLTSEFPPPQAYVMPNFVGQSLGGVTIVLQDAGFRLGTVNLAALSPAVDSSTATQSVTPSVLPPQPTPASIIVSQNPAPGAKIVAGSPVNLEVR
jgi:beta-lactam-binding protein with PASTA domain